jgi:hypothetical protein
VKRVKLDPRGHRALEEKQALLEHKVQRVPRVKMVKMVPRANMVPRVKRASRVQLALGALMVRQVKLALREHRVLEA